MEIIHRDNPFGSLFVQYRDLGVGRLVDLEFGRKPSAVGYGSSDDREVTIFIHGSEEVEADVVLQFSSPVRVLMMEAQGYHVRLLVDFSTQDEGDTWTAISVQEEQ